MIELTEDAEQQVYALQQHYLKNFLRRRLTLSWRGTADYGVKKGDIGSPIALPRHLPSQPYSTTPQTFRSGCNERRQTKRPDFAWHRVDCSQSVREFCNQNSWDSQNSRNIQS